MIVTKMNSKTILGVLVAFFAIVLAQTAFAGTYYYGGQAIYSDNARGYMNYFSGSNYGSSYNSNSYYYNSYQQVSYQTTGGYYKVTPYLEGFPDYYYYDYSGTTGTGRQQIVYGNSRSTMGNNNNWQGQQNYQYDDYHLDNRYYYYPSDGPYFDRYGRRYN